MSRTDKTQPYNVKALFYPSWVAEHHDHRDGVCNLPDRPDLDNIEWWRSSSDCHWTYSSEFWGSGMARCACRICARHFDWWTDPRDPKVQRRAARRYCRDGWRDEY